MSGRVDSTPAVEIGAPPLTTWKCGVGVATNRDTNTWCTPPTVSSQVTQGAVALAGFIVPAATRGSSASLAGSLLSEQFCSADREAAQLLAALRIPLPVLPITCQWKPPAPCVASASALAANTISLPARPCVPPFFSYQTTPGTPSLAPVKAMSGSIPSRLTSTFRLGSAPPGPTRPRPTCWKQNPPIAGTLFDASGTPAGVTPLQVVMPGPSGLDT